MRQATCDQICDLFGLEHTIVGTTRLRGCGHCVDHVFYDDGDYEHGIRLLNSKSAREIYSFLLSASSGHRATIRHLQYHSFDTAGRVSDKMYVVMTYQNDRSYSHCGEWLICGDTDGYVEAYRIARNAKRSGKRVRLQRGSELTFTPR